MFENVTPPQPQQPTNPQYGSPPMNNAGRPPVAPPQPPPPPQFQSQPRPQPSYGQPIPNYSQPQPVPKAGGVEDMFATTDNPYGPPRYGQPHPYGKNMGMPKNLRYGGGFSFGKLLIPILVLVVVVLLGVAGYLAYNYLYAGGSLGLNSINLNLNKSAVTPSTSPAIAVPNDFPTTIAPAQSPATSAPLVAPPGVPIPVIGSGNNSVGNPVIETSSLSSSALDSDGDDLTDVEERSLGTDPLNPDTDNDGLTDYAEVKIYYTLPNNPDTDGDGFQDGAEVINGFDPTRIGGARLSTTTN